MAEERKSILLRIPPELWEQVNRLAQRELRSINAQLEFLIREALRARGFPSHPKPAGADASEPGAAGAPSPGA